MRFTLFQNYLLFIFFNLSFTCVIGQSINLPSDSLSKYSYTIIGQIKKTPVLDMGTCSFFKSDGSLFIITANHVLYDCDTLTNKLVPKFEVAIIFIPTSSEFLQFRVPIPLDTCIIDYKDPDLFVAKVDSRWINKVNTINQFVLPPLKTFGKLTIFGQGMKSDSSYVGFDKQHNILLKEKSFNFFANTPVPDSNYIDTVHHFVETKEITVGRWMKGFSGSPVFLQDKKSKKWRFCGVFVQALYDISDKLPGGLILVSPNYIFKTINSMIQK